MYKDDNRSTIRAMVAITDPKIIDYYPDIITNPTHDFYCIIIEVLTCKVEHSLKQKCYMFFKKIYMIHTFLGINFLMCKNFRPDFQLLIN